MSSEPCAILLVEDEFLIAMDLQMQIEAAGYKVKGPAASVEAGMSILDDGPVCCAILDMNIRGSTSFPIAERLAEEGTPFIFLSGNDAYRLMDQFAGHTVLTKPINYPELLAKVKEICGF
ncbi:MAG: response regulator [Hyphomonas sp.]